MTDPLEKSVTCGDCGGEIDPDRLSELCPSCGSTRRKTDVRFGSTLSFKGSVTGIGRLRRRHPWLLTSQILLWLVSFGLGAWATAGAKGLALPAVAVAFCAGPISLFLIPEWRETINEIRSA